MRKRTAFLYLALLLLGALNACQGQGGGGGATPEQVVESYLTAKVTGDRDAVQRLLCLEMEDRLEAEASAFSAVSDVKIEGMACRAEEGAGLVRCQGKIVAAYGSEQTEFQLASYRVVEEDGAWKWCGEQ